MRECCRILIIDDNADLAEATAMMLKFRGFHTTTAHNGYLALLCARSFLPEIVLVDINLPDIDGYELASTIRRECGLQATLFIAISASDPDKSSPFFREADFDHYLIKPVDLDDLVKLLSPGGS